MRYGCIYVITNCLTQEQYVGQTIRALATRWASHKASAKKPKFAINKAINHYGEDAFTIEEVFTAFDRSALNQAEVEWVEMLSPIYNMTRGGAGSHGAVVSETTRVLRSKLAKERWADPTFREKTIAKIRAATPYEELRERGRRLGKSKGAEKRWANHTKKVKAPVDKAQITADSWKIPEIREKRMAGLRRIMATEAHRERKRQASIGRRHTDESKNKISRGKSQPVFCPELLVSFLSQKDAADFLGALRSSVCNAIKRGGKIGNKYSLVQI